MNERVREREFIMQSVDFSFIGYVNSRTNDRRIE